MRKIIVSIIISFLYIDFSYSFEFLKDSNNKYNLIYAVKNNDINKVKSVYNNKYINVKDKYGNNALSYAIYNENYDIIKFLLDSGIKPYVVDSTGMPTFCSARRSYDYKIKNIFGNYNYSYDNYCNLNVNDINITRHSGSNSSILNWKNGLIGIATIGGGVALLAAGGGGGGGSGGTNNGDGSSSVDTNYSTIGEVDSTTLDNILNGTNTDTIKYYSGYKYSGIFTDGTNTYTLSNYDDYNEIRLAYAWARGYTGKISTSTYMSSTSGTPYYLNDATGNSSYSISTNIKIAVLDQGVFSSNVFINNNLLTLTGDTNPNQLYEYYYNDCTNSKYCNVVVIDEDETSYSNYYVNCGTPGTTLTCKLYKKVGDLYTTVGSSFSVISNSSSPVNSDSSHGTEVSGIIASNPYCTGSSCTGSSGIAPDSNILPYLISMAYNFTDGGVTYNMQSFADNPYIGQAFESAGENGAVVINNSWGSGSLSDISSASGLTSYFRTSFLNSMINTVLNYNTIFVWAAGNDKKLQPTAESAIPLYLRNSNGNLVFYDSSTGYYKNFITVVAYDTSADSIADWSNKCGLAKYYCLTAPGSYLITTDNSLDELVAASGTSFSTPIVTGAIAVLKSAYPYLTGADITRLLFVTARDLGTAGVDEIYGWGMLDLERATRPYGATLVPIDSNITGSSYSLLSSGIKTNSIFSNALKKSDLSFVMLDSFNRTFTLNLNDYISTSKNRIDTIDIMKNFSNNSKTLKLNKLMSLYYNETNNYSLNSSNKEFELSYNTENLDNSDYGFNLYYGNSPYNAFINNNYYDNKYPLINSYTYNAINPYFINDSKNNFAFNNLVSLSNNLILNFGIVYQNYTINYDEKNSFNKGEDKLGSSIALINGLNYKFNDNFNTKFEFGLINEYKTLFGSKTDGAFNIGDNNITYLLSLENNLNIFDSKFSLFSKANFGYTKVNMNSNSSLIKNISDLYTDSFAIGFNYNLNNELKNENDNISLLISQPITIESGSMDISLPVARDYDGNIYYNNYNLDLKNERELDLQLSYNHKINNDKSLNFGYIFRNSDDNESIFIINYKKLLNF